MGRNKRSAMAIIAFLLGAVGLGAGVYSVYSVQTGAVKGDDGDDGDDGIILYVDEGIIPRTLVYKTSQQAIGFETIIDFEVKEYDTVNAFDLSTDNYTIPSDGYYYFHACLYLFNVGVGQSYLMYLYIDGIQRMYTIQHASSILPLTLTLTTILLLNQSNKITFSAAGSAAFGIWTDGTKRCTYLVIEKRS